MNGCCAQGDNHVTAALDIIAQSQVTPRYVQTCPLGDPSPSPPWKENGTR